MRSEVSSWVGGAPGGTVMVGAVPKVPAGDGACTGAVATVVGGAVGRVELDVGEVDGDVDDELLHPVRASTATPSTPSTPRDQGRRRGMGQVPFRTVVGG
ncbi:MAG: hypothetical protein ACRDYE_16170, partial [Acidimicrobiales bacterium]